MHDTNNNLATGQSAEAHEGSEQSFPLEAAEMTKAPSDGGGTRKAHVNVSLLCREKVSFFPHVARERDL
jgi:hypothetical protein